jgi:hypothetical protein
MNLTVALPAINFGKGDTDSNFALNVSERVDLVYKVTCFGGQTGIFTK